MPNTSEDTAISKLPKWAQAKIANLEMRLSEAKATFAEVTAGQTDTFVERMTIAGDHSLPNGSTVTFQLGSNRRDKIHVRASHAHEDGSNKYLIVSGDDTILIRPRSGNLVFIRLAEGRDR